MVVTVVVVMVIVIVVMVVVVAVVMLLGVSTDVLFIFDHSDHLTIISSLTHFSIDCCSLQTKQNKKKQANNNTS